MNKKLSRLGYKEALEIIAKLDSNLYGEIKSHGEYFTNLQIIMYAEFLQKTEFLQKKIGGAHHE